LINSRRTFLFTYSSRVSAVGSPKVKWLEIEVPPQNALYNAEVKVNVKIKEKVKFTLRQDMKAQRGSKGIALLFL
jgi:hypothetical protein